MGKFVSHKSGNKDAKYITVKTYLDVHCLQANFCSSQVRKCPKHLTQTVNKTKHKILEQIQGVPNRGDVRELRLSPKGWEAQSEWGGVINAN